MSTTLTEHLAAVRADQPADLRLLLPEELVRLAGTKRANVLEPLRREAAAASHAVSDEAFARNLAILRRFAAERGHAMPTRNEQYEGTGIGMWASTQRAQRKIPGKLSIARRLALEAQPGWQWVARGHGHDVRTAADASRLLPRAESYAAEHGHLTPKSQPGAEMDLREALARLRRARRHVHPEVQARFEALPGWTWDQGEADRMFDLMREQRARDKVTVTKWGLPFSRLQTYVDEHGDSRVPRRFVDETGYALGDWVAHMRRVRLDDWQRDALEALPGWDWTPAATRSHEQFDRGLEALRTYIRDHGVLPPSSHRTSEGFGLGSWAARHQRRRASLAQERVLALEAVPGWTWIDPNGLEASYRPDQQEHFETMLTLLVDYLTEHGRIPSVGERFRGRALGHWCERRRQEWRNGTLPAARAEALDMVVGWSWTVSAGSPRHRTPGERTTPSPHTCRA